MSDQILESVRKRMRDRNYVVNWSDFGGKIPPQALDLEEAILGALLIEKDAFVRIGDLIAPETFYKETHQRIFETISSLNTESQPIDLLTVTDKMRRNGTLDFIGGPYYLTQLTNKVTSSANIEYHARIIIEKFIQRELIRVSGKITTEAFEDSTDAFELLDKCEKEMFEIKNKSIKRSYDTIQELLNKAIKDIESRKSEGGLTGIPTGFTELDRFTAGFQKSDLIIIAARPGMGKTAFALSVARNAAVDYGKAVAIFSLEMSSVQLVTRLISAESEISSEQIKKGDLKEYEWQIMTNKIQNLSNAKIFIDDTPALPVLDLKAKCRRLKRDHDIGLVVIDYLQLMRGSEGVGNREQEISSISRTLKEMAKELDIPVIALAQLSREVEKRPDKKPMLSDLRESGSIEQDADIVGFIYRPEYYGITTDEDNNDITGQAHLILAKHRNGATGIARMKYTNHLAKFTDWGGAISYSSKISPLEENDIVTFSSKVNIDSEDLPINPFDNDYDSGANINIQPDDTAPF